MGRDAFGVQLDAVAIQLPHSTQYWLSKDVMMCTGRQLDDWITTGPTGSYLLLSIFSSLYSLWKQNSLINIIFIQQDWEYGLPSFNVVSMVDMFCNKKNISPSKHIGTHPVQHSK